jgi:hypothetical protein
MRRATLALALAPVIAGPAAGAFAATGTGQPATTSTSTQTPSGAHTASTGQQSTGQQSTGQQSTGQQQTSTSTSTQAPAADAHATAANVLNLLKIADTSAHSGGDGSSANADAISIDGNTLIDGKTGGSQTSQGSSSGALIDTGATPLGSLAVTPWSASSTQSAGSNSAAAEAALLHLTLIDSKTLDVYLLHSQSQSSWTPSESHSSSTSDGASANLGDGALDVKVLHSESSSDGKGSSYLLSINGNEIGSSDQANGQCVIDASPLATLTCLDASGGNGSSAADTATATLGGDSSHETALTSVSSKGNQAPTSVEGRKITKSNNNNNHNNQADRTPNTAASGALPFTGFESGLLATYGAMLAGLGTAIVRLGRRRKQRA